MFYHKEEFIMHRSIQIICTFLLVLSLAIAGCGQQNTSTSSASGSASSQKAALKVGVTPGPHAEVMDVVKKVAEKNGLELEVIEFNDYVQPNAALVSGEIDVNSFQHQPYLDNMVKDRGYNLVSVAKTIIFPMGVYSKKIKNISDIANGAALAIPNDPTNGGRALMLLEKAGLLKLKDGLGIQATVADIVENPKNIKIQEMDAAQIPRSLEDMDAAVINTNYAMSAGLVPNKDALILEDSNSPYANILATTSDKKDDPRIQQLIKIYQSDEVKAFVDDHFAGSAFAAW